MYSIGYPVGYHGYGGTCDALIPSLASHHVIARRNKHLGSRPIFSISCGVSVKQFVQDGKRAKTRSALPAYRFRGAGSACGCLHGRGLSGRDKVDGLAWRGWREDDDDVYVCVVGLGDRSRWRGRNASSQQVTDKTGAGLEVSRRVVVHVAASWKVGSAALLFGISRTAWFRRGCLVGWLRRDYGICFHSRFHEFTYIRYLYISYHLNTFTFTALQTQAKGSVP